MSSVVSPDAQVLGLLLQPDVDEDMREGVGGWVKGDKSEM